LMCRCPLLSAFTHQGLIEGSGRQQTSLHSSGAETLVGIIRLSLVCCAEQGAFERGINVQVCAFAACGFGLHLEEASSWKKPPRSSSCNGGHLPPFVLLTLALLFMDKWDGKQHAAITDPSRKTVVLLRWDHHQNTLAGSRSKWFRAWKQGEPAMRKSSSWAAECQTDDFQGCCQPSRLKKMRVELGWHWSTLLHASSVFGRVVVGSAELLNAFATSSSYGVACRGENLHSDLHSGEILSEHAEHTFFQHA